MLLDNVFHGNQAAVCVLEQWPDEELMMNITRENNFSETAFTVKEGDKWHLRWFTPGGEIDLCGHATLGTAYVLFRFFETEKQMLVFETLSGDLVVAKKDDLLEMEFPAYELRPVEVTEEMADAIGVRPLEAYMARDLLCVLKDETAVRERIAFLAVLLRNLQCRKIRFVVPGTAILSHTGLINSVKMNWLHFRHHSVEERYIAVRTEKRYS